MLVIFVYYHGPGAASENAHCTTTNDVALRRRQTKKEAEPLKTEEASFRDPHATIARRLPTTHFRTQHTCSCHESLPRLRLDRACDDAPAPNLHAWSPLSLLAPTAAGPTYQHAPQLHPAPRPNVKSSGSPASESSASLGGYESPPFAPLPSDIPPPSPRELSAVSPCSLRISLPSSSPSA
mmetsp:Transcript_33992/g.109824  ORF Transcript_33992/g.109824 Transcript_33992/m.109824 type:complete len:181 (+) Transcript_33992:52-594(+)